MCLQRKNIFYIMIQTLDLKYIMYGMPKQILS